MIGVERRKIVTCQRRNIDYSFLEQYYADSKKQKDIFFVYKRDVLKTLLGYENFLKIENQVQLDYFLQNSNNCRSGYEEKDAKEIFESNPLWEHLIVECGKTEGTFICRELNLDEKICREIYDVLKKQGCHVYRVRIPNVREIKEENRIEQWCKQSFAVYIKNIESGDLEAPWYIDKISDVNPKKMKVPKILHRTRLGTALRTIYLAGPCIVGGWENPEGERLGDILYQKIQDAQLGYSLEFVPLCMEEGTKMTEMLEKSVHRDDIVIMITHRLCSYEMDTLEVYNSYYGDKWLYQNAPIHTTVTGNRLLADFLMDKIIMPVVQEGNTANDLLYEGEPQFTCEMQINIQKYIQKIKNARYVDRDSVAGAVVMNCNPFTYGHRYLVEYAASQVDVLYVFVVEEDLSAVPFADRFYMTYGGVADIENVIVVPSGQFIISQDTFHNYFEKETEIHEVSAQEDAYLFARYIAPGLHISKRFVGEEPTDHVTAVYNETMRYIFAKYGLELVEIPRKRLSTGTLISATQVRDCLLREDWETIARYTPQTTWVHLRKIKETVRLRMKRQEKRKKQILQEQAQVWIDQISGMEQVVIYSIGHDTKGLLAHLPQSVVDRLEYCDRAARTNKIIFHGKQVAPPEALLQEYKDYQIVVTSTRFGAQIYEDFCRMGISMERCLFCTFCFNTNYSVEE